MLKKVLFISLLLLFLLACKSDKQLSKIELKVLDYNLDNVEVKKINRKSWDVSHYLTLEEVSKYGFNTEKYGKALKRGSAPFISNNILIFNTDKGVVWFTLADNKVINFLVDFKYLEKNTDKDLIVLVSKERLKLSNILLNKSYWEVEKSFSSIDRGYLEGDYLFLQNYDFGITSLLLKDGKQVWSLKGEEKLKVDRAYGKYKKWKYPEGDFFQFYRTSNLVFSNGYLVIGTDRGYLYLFRVEDGEPAFKIKLNRPGNGPVVSYMNNIYLGYPEGLFVISAETGELAKVIRLERDVRSLTINDSYLYGMGKSSIFKINLDNFDDNKLITQGFGSPFPESISISGGYLWKSPTAPYDAGFSFDGFNLEKFDKDMITFAKEGRGYAPMEVAEGQLEDDKNLDRFKKNHLLEWNDQFILVEPDEIVGYKVVPQE